MTYNWDFSIIFAYKKAIASGILITLGLTFSSIIFGSIVGLVLCLLKLSKNKYTKYPAMIIIEAFRDLPILVLLIWLFYTITPLTGLNISPFFIAVIALSINLGAFSAEIFRAGFNSIHKSQIEAAKSLGLKKIQILRYITLPQALKVILPPLTGQYIETIKLTSVASIISVAELLHKSQDIISVSYRPLEVYTAVAIIYLAIIIPLSLYLQKTEKKQNVRD